MGTLVCRMDFLMSPTVFREGNYRFYFFSKEETRMHVHVTCTKGEAKFWLEPIVALAQHYQLSSKELKEIQKIIEERADEIKKCWKTHFSS